MHAMVRCLFAGCVLCLLLWGCGKKPAADSPKLETAPAASAEPAAAETPAPTASVPPAEAPPVPANTAPSAPAYIPPVADAEAALGTLTQALRKYSAEKQRVPATLNEVVAAGYIQSLPQPPAGKRFVVDAKRVAVVLK